MTPVRGRPTVSVAVMNEYLMNEYLMDEYLMDSGDLRMGMACDLIHEGSDLPAWRCPSTPTSDEKLKASFICEEPYLSRACTIELNESIMEKTLTPLRFFHHQNSD